MVTIIQQISKKNQLEINGKEALPFSASASQFIPVLVFRPYPIFLNPIPVDDQHVNNLAIISNLL